MDAQHWTFWHKVAEKYKIWKSVSYSDMLELQRQRTYLFLLMNLEAVGQGACPQMQMIKTGCHAL